eukprot:gene14919-20068_t
MTSNNEISTTVWEALRKSETGLTKSQLNKIVYKQLKHDEYYAKHKSSDPKNDCKSKCLEALDIYLDQSLVHINDAGLYAVIEKMNSSTDKKEIKQEKKKRKQQDRDVVVVDDDDEITSLKKDSKIIKTDRNLNEDIKINKNEESNNNNHDNEKKEHIKIKKDKKIKINENTKNNHVPTGNNSNKSWKAVDLWKNGEQYWRENSFDADYLRTNPDRYYKETGEFYGSTFLEMNDPESAALAVQQDRTKFMGRPLKIYYCPPKPGDKWPPENSSSTHQNKPGFQSGPPTRQKTEKPPGCKKLYAGNLSYNIDDDTMVEFFKNCGTLVGLRWLTHKETEEFRGCGFIEFSSTEEADAAIKLDGKELLGRPIKLDWTN